MEQAYGHYKASMEMIDENPGKSLEKQYETTMIAARATKSCGCLLTALCSDLEMPKLRATVLAELKELRGHVGREAERSLLHPLLLERVQLVLKAEK